MQERTLVWEKCPRCGTPTPDGVLNCPKCGAAVVATPDAIAASQRPRRSGATTLAQLIAAALLLGIGLVLLGTVPVLGIGYFLVLGVIVLLRVLMR